jgi:hypothetical protein
MGTPLSNMLTGLLNSGGLPVQSFGDSNGVLELNGSPASAPSPTSSAGASARA